MPAADNQPQDRRRQQFPEDLGAMPAGGKIDATPSTENASWGGGHAGYGGGDKKIDVNNNINITKNIDNSKKIGVYNDHPTYNVDNSKNIDNSKKIDVYKDNRHTPTSTTPRRSTSTSR